MQQNIDPVITGWVELPQRVLEAEGGVREGKILRRRVGGKPDAPQAVGCGEQRIVGDVLIVVPNEAGPPRGLIGEDNGGNQQQTEQPGQERTGTGW